MRRPGGYLIVSGPGGTTEADTVTCSHCGKVVVVKVKQDPSEMGGFCRLCMKHLCGPCADKGGCDPFEKKMERMEARDRSLRAMGIR